MPDFRYDPGVYVTNGGTPITHGWPAANSGYVGIALKQQQPAWDDSLANQAVIKASEPYYLKTKGECRVKLSDHAGIAVTTKGTPIYIIVATGLLTTTSAGNTYFGRITDTSGTRGLPTGHIRIDMDFKV